jgi:hypothetical protein
MMLGHYAVTEENWREAILKQPHFAISESPRFVGRAVAALAADPDKRGGPGVQSRAESWPRSTDFGIWMARSPTAGATWSRSRTPAVRPMSPNIGEACGRGS